MNMYNKINIRKAVFLAILSICVVQTIILPIIVEGQNTNEENEFTTEDILDLRVRRAIWNKKGTFYETIDMHTFYFKMKQDVKYVTRIKITAEYGGYFFLTLRGFALIGSIAEDFTSPITNQVIEIKAVGDATTNGRVTITYIDSTYVANPVYTFYLNKAGFAGWWWIALSGIAVLAVLVVLITFAIIGMKSVAKRKKMKK